MIHLNSIALGFLLVLLVGCSTTKSSRFTRQFNVVGTETVDGAIIFCKRAFKESDVTEKIQNCVSWFGFDIIGDSR